MNSCKRKQYINSVDLTNQIAYTIETNIIVDIHSIIYIWINALYSQIQPPFCYLNCRGSIRQCLQISATKRKNHTQVAKRRKKTTGASEWTNQWSDKNRHVLSTTYIKKCYICWFICAYCIRMIDAKDNSYLSAQ